MNFTPEEHKTFQLKFGDILLNEGQSIELVGRPAMFRDELPDVCFTNTLVRFRSSPAVDSEYALLVFLSYFKNGRFRKIAKAGTNIAHLGADRFAQVEFPVPPLNEQRRIVKSIRKSLDAISTLQFGVRGVRECSSKIRASTLATAFSGRLVSQNPIEGTGHDLLNQILAAKDAAESSTATRLTRKSKR